MNYKFLLFIFSVCCLLAMTGCHKEGCTDPSAINYDVTADKDDGSCIVCSTIVTPLDSMTLYITDYTPGSIHYNEAIARVTLTQKVFSPSDNHCDEPICNIYMSIESLLPSKMYLLYRVQRETGPVNVYAYDFLLMDGHETIDVGLIETMNYPPFLELGLDSVSATLNGPAYYY